ncbi:MAG: quinone oxidoreductase [Candidatus Dormibacteraeota bacterium]|nr:quinone oxidoreductase [Candidatus Dormibacteraeota bacterium]MBO0704753.1 quinone oxidoreductase [Candidatus Dormibacteraeota bacterium]MBO0760951.1 quinone oxidoreductase [Candidatus Dormibacteraeota bacterium]
MRAIQVQSFGGPEVLEVVQVDAPRPGPGQVLVDVAATGVNYIDTYHRSGTYNVPLPLVPGSEGAGTVSAVGEGVKELRVGDRVGWVAAPQSYAEQVVVNEAAAIPVPAGISDEVAAAVLLQGLTAHYLCTSTYAIQPGDTALVHAAAGGVGLLLTQMVKMRGGTVIATVSTDEKAKLARGAGADEVIRYDQVEFAPEVRRLTDGVGVAVVYDGVGKDTFDASLASLRPRGMMALYGGSSGQVPPFDPQRLNGAGALFLTRPSLGYYAATREELLGRAQDVFGWIQDGRLDVRIGGRYSLDDARSAHADLQSRRTTGKLLLLR